jgi:diaminopimelate decarboxylase/aspartate kinase
MSDFFNPTINRPSPWWSSPTAREQLLQLAKPLTHNDELSQDDQNDQNCEQTDGFYIYSKKILLQKLQNLKDLKSIDKIFFAQKANNCQEIVKLFAQNGAGIECVSVNELKSVLQLFPFMNGSDILYTPNFSSKREMTSIRKLFDTPERRQNENITQLFPFVTIDNMYILENWDIQTIFQDMSIFLRVAPNTDGYGHHSHVSTGASSKFGITTDDLGTFFTQSAIGQNFVSNIRGLHMHKGSSVSSSDEWAKTANDLTSHLSLFPQITHIDIGGGIPIPYKPTDPVLDLAAVDNELYPIKQKYPNLTFCIEPGRYLVAESGIILTRINQLKSKACYKFVGIGIGMTGLIRPALYNSYHHIVNLTQYDQSYLAQGRDGLTMQDNTSYGLDFVKKNCNEQNNEQNETKNVIVNVVGPICETGDYLGQNRIFPATSCEGDIVVIDSTGAYGRVMASQYNLRYPADDVLVDF